MSVLPGPYVVGQQPATSCRQIDANSNSARFVRRERQDTALTGRAGFNAGTPGVGQGQIMAWDRTSDTALPLQIMANPLIMNAYPTAGNVGIGTESPSGKLGVVGSGNQWSGYFSGATYGLYARGNGGQGVYGYSSGNWAGYFIGTYGAYINGGGADVYLGYSGYSVYTGYPAYFAGGGYWASDRRMKNDIAPISDSILKLGKIEGVSFTWNQGSKKGQQDIGVIAQDVQKVVPEAVTTGPNGMLGVDYTKLVPLLINEIKEQQKRIESLEADTAALRQDIEELTSVVDSKR